MSDYEFLDKRFDKLIIGHAKLERLWTGSRWAEGPVYVPSAKHLLWSDIPNDRLLRYDETDGSVSVFETPCNYQNGHTLDREGRVVTCEHGGRRVSRLEHDGRWQALVESVDGKRFNSPNDVVVKSDRTIWFTDPVYGIDSHYEGKIANPEIGGSHVYRFDEAAGELTTVITDSVQPNGLAFSPDETVPYVSDTGASHVPGLPRAIHAYELADNGRSVRSGDAIILSETTFLHSFICQSCLFGHLLNGAPPAGRKRGQGVPHKGRWG
ncbi:SMP-30/gluconolactonase/LRE family protein [Mesorhizobium argentiipisi]|uniref:SMP-30/gluconolactonase/LRE family protein n=1 Tax=Mesorhizobium argentiipisi TaxID=3015175 RepID=A0ABU8KAJ8_9HYPH